MFEVSYLYILVYNQHRRLFVGFSMAVPWLGRNLMVSRVAVCKIIIFFCNFQDFACKIQNGCVF